MKLYNQLSRQVEDFTPIDPDHVKIYTCGPTVYDYVHVGNLTSYIYWDLLLRTLQANGYTPYRVLNITDVGHLTSDEDQGEDKLEKGAKREGKTVWEIADHYTEYFFQQYRSLHLLPPAKVCRATDYILQDQALVDQLTANGYTYETSDGVYFDTAKFPTYADFAQLDLDHLRAGARVDFNNEKRNVSDFALWKFIQDGEDHAMRWGYLGRPGYPGWHLECSTIIHTELGETIDIHTGGIDHLPVHHTNEIAQTEAAYGQKMCNYWLHCHHITVDGTKISKSLGNGYRLEQLAEQGFAPLDFKLWVLQGHYQSERNFSLDDLAAARARRLNWRNQLALCYQSAGNSAQSIDQTVGAADNSAQPAGATDELSSTKSQTDVIDTVLAQIKACLDDNLNSPEALAVVDRFLASPAYQPSAAAITEFWQPLDQLLGLNLVADTPDIAPDDYQKIQDRQAARQARDFATADRLRDQLAEHNLTVKDTPTGPVWQYLS